jgi:tetratricopeptide (TPR) repeat protein
MLNTSRAVSVVVVACLLAGAVPASVAAQSAEAYLEFLMARRLEQQGDQAGALAALQRAAVADPKSAEVKAEIAGFQLRRNRRPEAERAAREALTLNDDNIEAHRVLGQIYAAVADTLNGRSQAAQLESAANQAIAHLERVVADTTSVVDLTLPYTLGRLYLRVGNTAKAVEALTRVVNQNPNSVQARLLLAQAFAASDDVKGAVETLDAIVEDEPRVASTLAQYQEQAGLLKDAADNYTRALALQPMSRELKFRRAAVMFSAKEYERSATFAAEAQTQHPDDLRFPRLHARALFAGGSADKAFSVLEPTARAFPRDANTQFALADLYNDSGRDRDAERTIRQFLTVEPDNADALNYLGYLLADKGRALDEAIKLVERALDADPNNPSYLDSLGWAHFRRGDFEQAEKYLTPAATRLDNNAVIQDHFGDVLAARGRIQDAIAAWTKALASEGEGIDRTVVQKKIDDAKVRLNR